MDVDRAHQREQMRAALQARGADLTLFEDAVNLDKLWDNWYRNVRALSDATREGLSVAGLQPGLIDHILALKDAPPAALPSTPSPRHRTTHTRWHSPAATTGGSSTSARDVEHPRGEQAAPSPVPSSAQPRKSDIAKWWPAGWLDTLAPLWSQVCGGRGGGDIEGSQQKQQQFEDSAAASTMPNSSGPQLVLGADTHTPGATNSVLSSSLCLGGAQHPSTCRQRRSNRAGVHGGRGPVGVVRKDGVQSGAGPSLILLVMHLAGAHMSCSVHHLVVSVAGLLQSLGAPWCPRLAAASAVGSRAQRLAGLLRVLPS
ncbi:hypothetical protein CHLRE_05g242301v5 [Chlamydomonas reinhardtii]|uniref:Uncharacterized protein n=1 Tax=Chlamydomonas reinhardtii TaxID=3055 RepID=A0A2K3DSG0_CHLRE|nr:uncharacterized protein CHLRE_05g242301v5 [Chlamydomonas reinhardtii]PNW83469.1 hypothetical protein CHLRE_05g242301v5 [Chlamydomonas reinhardtii]